MGLRRAGVARFPTGRARGLDGGTLVGMRLGPPLLLTAVLGLGLWFLLGGFDRKEPDADPPETPSAAETDPERERMEKRFGLKTGTLAVEVRTIDGKRPMLAEVGYLLPGGEPRWLGAAEGRRVITDAPLGMLTAVARAPGYAVAEQPCQVVAGVRSDVVITLRPGDPEESDAASDAGG